MSYYEALADNIRISKKNGFTIYYRRVTYVELP